jgi:hypothetical protein
MLEVLACICSHARGPHFLAIGTWFWEASASALPFSASSIGLAVGPELGWVSELGQASESEQASAEHLHRSKRSPLENHLNGFQEDYTSPQRT